MCTQAGQLLGDAVTKLKQGRIVAPIMLTRRDFESTIASMVAEAKMDMITVIAFMPPEWFMKLP